MFTEVLPVIMALVMFPPSKASVPESLPLPSHASPEFGFARIDDKGGLTVRYTELTTAWVTTLREERYIGKRRDPATGHEIADSLVRRVPMTTSTNVIQDASTDADSADYWVHRSGNLVAAKDARLLLAHWTPVVFIRFAKRGQELDRFYHQFLPRDAIVVTIVGTKPINLPGRLEPVDDAGVNVRTGTDDGTSQKPLQYLPRDRKGG
jgi:hypothetical protein